MSSKAICHIIAGDYLRALAPKTGLITQRHFGVVGAAPARARRATPFLPLRSPEDF